MQLKGVTLSVLLGTMINNDMKKVIVSIICILGSLFSFSQKTFQHSYGTKSDEVPMAFIQTADKGYALLGSTGGSSGYGYLVKTDSLGNKLWSKEYDVLNFAITGVSIIQTKDKHYIICDQDNLIKTDSLGNLIWENSYYGSGSIEQTFAKAIEVSGGYVIVGSTSSGNGDASIMKIDTSGNVIWASESPEGFPQDMALSKYDSCFYLITASDSNMNIIKVSKSGEGIWSKSIYINGIPSSYDDAQINESWDGKKIALSLTNGMGQNVWFSFDTSGTVINTLSYPTTVSYFSWAFCSNPKYIFFTIGTNDTISGTQYNHIALFKTDTIGNIAWSYRIGGIKDDYPIGVLQATDVGIAIFGSTQNFSEGLSDFYFIKSDSLGNSGCNQTTFSVNTLTTVHVSLHQNNDSSGYIVENKGEQTCNVASINDTNFNDCICHSPIADFNFSYGANDTQGVFFDNSTWVTHWYWSFGDGTLDSTDISPVHQYKDTGAYNVCLTVKNSCGLDSSCQIIHYPNLTLGIETVSTNTAVNVFPNPSTGLFTLNIKGVNEKTTVHVYNMLGEEVYAETLRQAQGDNTIDLTNQPAGIYLYRITSEKGELVGSGKLVIIN